MPRKSSVLASMAFAILTSIWGCGSSTTAPNPVKSIATVPAAGVLTYQGKPLAFHQVNVVPDAERGAAGVSDEEGKFILGTNKAADGAPVGTHRVFVVYVGNPKDDPVKNGLGNVSAPPPEPDVKIDQKYQKAETSGLTVEIPASGSKTLQIDLQ